MWNADADARGLERDAVGGVRRPVLVAVGAEGGMQALAVARAIAARESRPLVVTSIVELGGTDGFDADAGRAPDAITAELRDRLRAVDERLARLGPAPFGAEEPTVDVRAGEARRAIPDLARQRQAHVIVMGTGPRTLASRLLGAETTLATIRHSPCPVLAVPEVCRVPARSVVVAMDFSAASLHAAREAFPLLADGAIVHLVHVWQREAAHAPGAEELPRDAAYLRSLPERFYRVRKVLGRERSLSFLTSVREGHAAATILDAARETEADLIVAGAHGHNVLERMLLGSVSAALLRGTPCAVFLAPEPSPVERGRLERVMRGTSVVRRADEWAQELDAFARRNHARRTTLEVDSTAIGAQVQESGYTLTGATYDHRDRVVSLMFGDPRRPDVHLTRTLGRVRSVAVTHDAAERDAALCIECDGGCTLLTFQDAGA